jgi:protein O-mannosyl-transferase
MTNSMYKYDYIYTFICSCMMYLNTLNAGLLYDDETGVVRNPCVVDKRSTIYDVFRSDFWGYPLHMAASHKSYRPITTLSFRIQVQYINGNKKNSDIADVNETHVVPNSRRLHLVNILLFATVSACFCNLVHTVFPSPRYNTRDKNAVRLAVLLFIAHPVHTEAVANIVGRCELLSALFMLLSFSTYINYIATGFYGVDYTSGLKKKKPPEENCFKKDARSKLLVTVLHSIFWYALSIILVTLAMLSKEQGVTGIGLWFIIDVIYLIVELNFDIQKIQNEKYKNSVNSSTSIFSHIEHIISNHWKLFVYFLFRQIINLLILTAIVYQRVQMNTHLPVFSKLENPIAIEPNIYTRVLSYSYINTCNIFFFIFPWNLAIDWSAGYPFELITSIFDGRLILPFFTIVIVSLILLDITFGTKIFFQNIKNRLYFLFGLSIMIITFIPSSNMFFPVGFIWAERVLFAPSFGFVIMYGHVISTINHAVFRTTDERNHSNYNNNTNQRKQNKNIEGGINVINNTAKQNLLYYVRSNIFPAIILFMFVIRTICRNNDWENGFKLYTSAVKTLPLNPRNHHGIATFYSHYKDKAKNAEEHFLKAIELYDKYGESMNSLAMLYETTNRTEEAIEMYRKAIVASPGLYRPFVNLANILEETALNSLDRNNKNKSDSSNFPLERLKEAEKHFFEAAMLPTVVTDRRYNILVRLGILRLRIGEFIKAADAFQQAVAVQGVTDVTALNILATMHVAAGRFDTAIEMYKRVIDKSLKTPQHLKNNEIYNKAMENLKTIKDHGNEYFQKKIKMSFCTRMLPSVRKKLEQIPLNGILEEHLVAKKNIVLLVFEDQTIRGVTEPFCENNLFGSEQCEMLIKKLEMEKRILQVEANGKPLGEVRYNVILDNREPLTFSMDGKEVTLLIKPNDDPVVIASEICKKHLMREEDCLILQQAVSTKRDISIANIKERFDRNPFNVQMNICKEQILAEARALYNYLEEGNTQKIVKPMEKRKSLKKYSNMTLGALGMVYYEEGKRVANDEQRYDLARIYIRYGIFFSAMLIADIGADEAKSRIGIDFGKMISDILSISNHLKKYVNPSSIWKKAMAIDSVRSAPKPNRVAIVSMCQYDPSKTSLGMLSIHNKMVYKNRHGYSLFIESTTPDNTRPIAWGKIKVVQKYFQIGKEQSKFDWVVWVDCDSFFMNTKLQLNLLLSDTMTENRDLIVSEDGMMLNTGFFAIRTKSKWIDSFLNDVYYDDDENSSNDSRNFVNPMVFIWHPWWEQASMMFLLRHMDQIVKDEYVKYYPQRILNSYPKEYSNPVHDHFTKRDDLTGSGAEHDIDFIVAFSGCKTYISSEECNKLYELYANLSET